MHILKSQLCIHFWLYTVSLHSSAPNIYSFRSNIYSWIRQYTCMYVYLFLSIHSQKSAVCSLLAVYRLVAFNIPVYLLFPFEYLLLHSTVYVQYMYTENARSVEYISTPNISVYLHLYIFSSHLLTVHVHLYIYSFTFNRLQGCLLRISIPEQRAHRDESWFHSQPITVEFLKS